MMNRLKPAALGIVRHILTTGGGFLVASGALTSAQAETTVGALIALIGVVWSVIDKRVA
jgi:hypothetical protein